MVYVTISRFLLDIDFDMVISKRMSVAALKKHLLLLSSNQGKRVYKRWELDPKIGTCARRKEN